MSDELAKRLQERDNRTVKGEPYITDILISS